MIAICVDFNSLKKTLRMMKSVLEFEPNCNFVIIDNSERYKSSTKEIKEIFGVLGHEIFFKSPDNDLKDIVPSKNQIFILSGHGNIGFGGGANLGINFVKSFFSFSRFNQEIISLINPDAIFKHFDPKEIPSIFNENNNKVLIGPSYLNDKNIHESPYQYYGLLSGLIFKKPMVLRKKYICGACIFFHFSQLSQIEFDEANFFLFWEETDLQVSLRKQGWIIDDTDKVVISHETGGTMPSKEFALHEFSKSRCLFFAKNYSVFSLIFISFSTLIQALRYLLLGKSDLARALVYGLASGLKNVSNL